MTAPNEIWRLVERDGGVIIEQLFDQGTVAAFNAEVDGPLAELQPGGRDPDYVPFFGANTKRLTNMIVISETFRESIIQNPLILAIADHVMHPLSDSYWMTSAQLIENRSWQRRSNTSSPRHWELSNLHAARACSAGSRHQLPVRHDCISLRRTAQLE